MEALLGLDLGTSAVKSLLLSPQGDVLAVAAVAYPTRTPCAGWVEQEPTEWWEAAVRAVRASLEKLCSPVDILAIGLSGHMSGLCLVDPAGQPLMPCITLTDVRSAAQTKYLHEHFRDELLDICGNLPVDAFLLPKLLWVKEQLPHVLAKARVFLFPKDYLLYRLTGRFVSEPTDAGNSMLFHLNWQAWDEAFISRLGLPLSLFPPCVRSTDVVGPLAPAAASELGLPAGVPVVAGAADMACSAIGTGAVKPGTVSVTIGTAAQVLTTVSGTHAAGAGKITFHRHAVPGRLYALGSVFTGGLAVNWLSSLLHDGSSSGYDPQQNWQLAELAGKVPPERMRLWFLPFLVGRGSPGFDANLRAAFVGLSLDTSRGALARAVMEGVAFNIRECIDAFRDMGYPVQRIHVGGGGFRLPVWRDIMAGVLGQELIAMETGDASTLGAAILAGIGVGEYDDIAAAAERLVQTGPCVKCDEAERDIYERKYAVYRQLLDALEPSFREMNSI